jgi:hypothetical protein
MKILLAGASPHTEATIRLIASSVFRGAALHMLERTTPGSLPHQSVEALRCGLCVVDVQGLGWSQWYPEHAARAEALLAGRAAVLLLPPDSDGAWNDAPRFTAAPDRILLRRPISAAGIACALRSAATEATRADEATDQAYLRRNIWLQSRSTPTSPPAPLASIRAEHSPSGMQHLTNMKRNVFRYAASTLFS